METLLFWTLPVIAALIGLKSRMMMGWRLFSASIVALYIGVWVAPMWWGLLDFFPTAIVPYRNAIAILLSVTALFAVLYKASAAIAPRSHDELFVFPKLPEMVLNVLFHFGFGFALSAFIFVLCCAAPLKLLIRNNGEGMQAKAGSALLKITAVGDKLTMSTPKETTREEIVASLKLWYEPQNEERGGEEDKKSAAAAPTDAAKSTPAKPAAGQGKNTRPSSAPKSPVPGK